MLPSERETTSRSPDDELDRLLRQARWPEPTAESAQRLTRRWAELSRRPSMPIWRPILAIAAAVAIVLIGGRMFRRADVKPVPRIAVRPTVVIEVRTEVPAAGRPLTDIELAVFRVIDKQQHAAKPIVLASPRQGVALVPAVIGWPMPAVEKPAVAVVPAPPDPARLAERAIITAGKDRDRALDQLVAIRPARAAQPVLDLLARPETSPAMIAALARHPAGWSDVLFAALNDRRVPVRSAAAITLARIDGPVNTARLIAMANADVNRREAIAALVRIESPDARLFVRFAKQSPQLSGIVRSALAQM
jgi:hypothetical protein